MVLPSGCIYITHDRKKDRCLVEEPQKRAHDRCLPDQTFDILLIGLKFLIGEYGDFRLEFDQYTDGTAYQIPFKFSYQIHIRSRSVCLVGLGPMQIKSSYNLLAKAIISS
jgi:hypothetical protein